MPAAPIYRATLRSSYRELLEAARSDNGVILAANRIVEWSDVARLMSSSYSSTSEPATSPSSRCPLGLEESDMYHFSVSYDDGATWLACEDPRQPELV